MSLQFSSNKDTLRDYFEKMTGKHIALALTDNSTSLLSMRTKGNVVSVRMHWMFLNAGDEVIREVADFIKTRQYRTPLIREFINNNKTCLKKREQNAGQARIRTQGRFYNLGEIFDDLNNEYFRGRIAASISWGKGKTRRMVKKRTLGSYCEQTKSIRINPVLDRVNVPQYFIRYVVYHEMLHSILEGEKQNGRRLIHSLEFQKRERLFRDYAKAVSWEMKWV
jgi:hypothetical protein